MSKKRPPINYTSREFDTILQDLLSHSKRYYADTFRDFSENSFGLQVLESVSYIGDQLSFYLDYASSEAFQDTAIEYNNVVRHARDKGFKINTNPSSFGFLTFYILVPALSTGLGPNYRYAPTLRRGSQFSTTGGNLFLLMEDLDFANSDNEVVIARVNEVTGVPTYYAIKVKGRAISGELQQVTKTVGSFQKFLKLPIGDERVSEVISVFDNEGHEYFEVPFLAQDIVYRAIANRDSNKSSVPRILKPTPVPRRFVVERELGNTFLQFGSGTDSSISAVDVLDPSNTTLQINGKNYLSSTSFDPTKLIESDKMGIAPANTQLTIILRKNTASNVNASVDTITRTVKTNFKFSEPASLQDSEMSFIVSSLEVTNEERFVGDVSIPTVDEIKMRSKSYFATQDRAVSTEDYKAMVYAMPPEFGAVKRVNLYRDTDAFRRNLNLYIVSENADGELTEPNSTLKTNLRSWVGTHKMINDSVDILDARIVNFGIDFEIVAEQEKNKHDVLANAISVLQDMFFNKMDIGESILISKIYNKLNEADGVEDVVDVRVVPKIGTNYATTRYNFDKHLSPDGRVIEGYQNLIFELKYPFTDIKGTVL